MSNFNNWLNHEVDKAAVRREQAETQTQHVGEILDSQQTANISLHAVQSALSGLFRTQKLVKQRQLATLKAISNFWGSQNSSLIRLSSTASRLLGGVKTHSLLQLASLLLLLMLLAFLCYQFGLKGPSKAELDDEAEVRQSINKLGDSLRSFDTIAKLSKEWTLIAQSGPSIDRLAFSTPSIDRLALSSSAMERLAITAPYIDRLSLSSPAMERLAKTAPYIDRLSLSSPAMERLAKTAPYIDRLTLSSPYIEEFALSAYIDRITPTNPSIEALAFFDHTTQSSEDISNHLERLNRITSSLENTTAKLNTLTDFIVEKPENRGPTDSQKIEIFFDGPDPLSCRKISPCELLHVSEFPACSVSIEVAESAYSTTVSYIAQLLGNTNRTLTLDFLGSANNLTEAICESNVGGFSLAFERAAWLRQQFVYSLSKQLIGTNIDIKHRVKLMLSAAGSDVCDLTDSDCLALNRNAVLIWYFSDT